jgi:predicted transcriptional regulator
MSREQATISLPREMLRQVDKVSKREHRTRSELVREALRVYFARVSALPVYTPTAAEVRAMEKGRAEIRRGHYYTLDELRRSLDTPHRGTRAKGARARTTPRTRPAARRT